VVLGQELHEPGQARDLGIALEQVVRTAAQRRELVPQPGRAELEHLWKERAQPGVARRRVLARVRHRTRHEDLAAVADVTQARRAGERLLGRAAVQRDAQGHGDRRRPVLGPERALQFDRTGAGRVGSLESGQGRAALTKTPRERPAVSGDHAAGDAVLSRERCGHLLRRLLPQRGRSFDIGE